MCIAWKVFFQPRCICRACVVSFLIMLRYSLCKHGPCCKRYRDDRCGFAHSLREISIPAGSSKYGRWVDESHIRGRPAGIDFFLGQKYTIPQHERVLMYAVHCKTELPDWVNMYLWFVGHPLNQLTDSIDFNWLHNLALLESNCRPCIGSDIEIVLSSWKPPFRYGEDFNCMSFVDRMTKRISQGQVFPIQRSLKCMSEEQLSVYRHADATSMHWGPCSRQYLSYEAGDMFVVIGACTGTGAGWIWVKRMKGPVYGWVSGFHLGPTSCSVFDEDLTQGVYSEQSVEAEYVAPNLRAGNLGICTPDGVDLTQYNALAVCYSDGSVDDRRGFGVGALCIFPNDDCEWVPAAVSLRLHCIGSATAELIGVCLNLGVLLTRKDDYQNAVVYCDNNNVVQYVGDYTGYQDPPEGSLQGMKLYPLILYAREQLQQLRLASKFVFLKHMPRQYNAMDSIAYGAMVSRRQVEWMDPDLNFHRISGNPGLYERILKVEEYSKQIDRGVHRLRM